MIYLSDWSHTPHEYLDKWGSKAYNLGKLIHTGMYYVPQGIVLMPQADITELFNSDTWTIDRLFGLNQFKRLDTHEPTYAVRSSGLAEDGDVSSYAGQHDTFLNVEACNLQEAIEACRASGVKAKAYREAKGEAEQGIAVLVQKMVSPIMSGVTFTSDPFTMDLNTYVIEYTNGLGAKLVSGEVNPDGSYEVNGLTDEFTPSLNTDEWDGGTLEHSRRSALRTVYNECKNVQKEFGVPMDIEWAVDHDYKVWILQARPLTTGGKAWVYPELVGRPVVGGRVEGKAVWADTNEPLDTPFDEGNILFAVMTNPHMVPLMKKSAGIATQVGGRTCHAAIVSRELNKPCIVSITNLSLLPSGTQVVLDANKGTLEV